MNVPEGVNTEAENLLSRIPIRDSTFFDEFFVIFQEFLEKWSFLEILGIFGKRDPGTPRGRFLGKVRGQNREKGGQNQNLRNKLFILPEF